MLSGGIGPDVINIWDHFDLIKTAYFGTASQRNDQNTLQAKKMSYHYCLFIHQIAYWNATSGLFEPSLATGRGERPGNDFIVATGTFSQHGGTRDQQAAAFMHELGHNLGLKHGGQDDINYKPNYLSIMNYLYEFDQSPIWNRPLDYSREKLKTLDESDLDEIDGLGVDYVSSYSRDWRFTARPVWYTFPTPHYEHQVDSFRNIDWSQTGIPLNSSVQANINNFPQWYPYIDSPGGEILESYEDWGHLNYDFRSSPSFPDNTHIDDPSMNEITTDVVELMHQAALNLHDIAITNITSSQSTINVSLFNQGGNEETFNLTVYANETSIASQTVTLARWNPTTITFTWNTIGVANGNYTISAYATPVTDETDTADNTYIDGIVQIKVLDNVPPVTTIDIGEPKYVFDTTIYLTSATPITLMAEDNPGGSGVASTAYRVHNATYSSGWLTYTGPFHFTHLAGGTYHLSYNSIDNLGNRETTKTTNIILSLIITESLPVDAFTRTVRGWDERGHYPDKENDDDCIYTQYNSKIMSWFSFKNSSAVSGAASRVSLHVQVKKDHGPGKDEHGSSGKDDHGPGKDEHGPSGGKIQFYLKASGVPETLVGEVDPSSTSWKWFSFDISSLLDSLEKINSAQLKVVSKADGKARLYVNAAYLNVTCGP